MLITVSKSKDARGRVGGYVASVNGAFSSCVQPSPAEAKAETERALRLQAEFCHVRRFFFAADGKTVYCLAYSDGWTVDIVSADRKTPASWMCGRNTTLEAMRNDIRTHLTNAYGGVISEN